MWRHVAQSLQGPSHAADGSACQDSHLVRFVGNKPARTIIACVADGAGSAKRSDLGSAVACETIADCAARYFESYKNFDQLQLEKVIDWCETTRDRLRQTAESNNCKLRDLATTLCVAILSPASSIFFQIGDGAITVGNDGIYGVVFWPQSGEYANVTNFMTSDNYQDHIEFQATTRKFSDLAMFTDGIERLALDFETQTPHLPFFHPLFQAVRNSKAGGSLSDDLAQFLQSDSVKNRSDDDKTLVLATQLTDPSVGGQDAAD
ncbi:MAG: PP2C family serine/threonine-protein phosphatase [Planctomycetota bacterium]